MKVSIIVAQASNRGIGYDNKLMWRQSDDLKRFKQLTTGHTVIMGRKTFDSIGKPLPNRKNIIISRKADLQIDGCIVVNSIEAALQLAQNESASEVFIIGGGEIYALTLPISNTLYVTEINTDLNEADAFFPEIDKKIWKIDSTESFKADEKNQFDYQFINYSKI